MNKKIYIKMAISWILVILWAGVIFYLSSKSAPESTVQSRGMINSFTGFFGKSIGNEFTMIKIDGIVRETAHGIEYFILGVLVFNALFTCLNNKKLLFISKISILICAIYALSDEIHQIPIPGRAFQLMDLGIDFIGIILGVIVVAVYITISSCTHQE